MDPDVRALIERFTLQFLPAEGMLYAETYRSAAATAMLGLYCNDPPSRSRFHRLAHDEVWHAYAGDPFRLVLLYPGGADAEVVMGAGAGPGRAVQFTVPAGTWQAGELLSGGRFALFGCTMAPGFTPACFEAGAVEPLLAGWPARAADIRRLAVRE